MRHSQQPGSALRKAGLAAAVVVAASAAAFLVLRRRDETRAKGLVDEAMGLAAAGRTTEALARVKDAEKFYQDAGSIRITVGRPAWARLLTAEAELDYQRGRWPESAQAALDAITLGSTEAYTIRARALVKLARLMDALLLFDFAVRAHPESADLFAERGDVQMRLVRLQDAVSDETKALALGASGELRLRALLTRARTRLAMGDAPDGEADLSALLETEPSNALARLLRGQSRLGRKDFDGAIEDATALAKADPNNGPAYLLRAEANLDKGRTGEARRDLRTASKLLPGHPKVSELFEKLRKEG
jgi:tetratricopeptide (TPR) repeat protein